ncbi:protein of unknown function [Rhodovastum atsumiense]|nr:protein of unknown function [Rhodovastum atsumiense]
MRHRLWGQLDGRRRNFRLWWRRLGHFRWRRRGVKRAIAELAHGHLLQGKDALTVFPGQRVLALVVSVGNQIGGLPPVWLMLF